MKKILPALFAAALIASPAFAEHHEDKKHDAAPAVVSKDVDVSTEHGEHHTHDGHTHDATHAHDDHKHTAKDNAPVDAKDAKQHHDEKKADDHGHAH